MKYFLYFVGPVLLLCFILGKISDVKSKRRAKSAGLYPAPGETVSDANIKRLAEIGEKILAIKFYRQAHGCGLKEAKEAVEKLSQS